jgi:hypothetical protein
VTSYPGAIWTPPTRSDGVDQVTAVDYNTPAAEIAAIEGELGTDPKGTFASVKARLDRHDTIGADIYRAATSSPAADTASGSRTLTGYDTTRQVDTGFTVSLAAGTITVPSTGWYLVSAHVRLSANYTGGLVLMSVNDGTNDVVRGNIAQSSTGGYLEIDATGPCTIAAGTVLRAVLFTSTSTSTVGDSTGTRYYFRVVRL